jgi:hypothetical protein
VTNVNAVEYPVPQFNAVVYVNTVVPAGTAMVVPFSLMA